MEKVTKYSRLGGTKIKVFKNLSLKSHINKPLYYCVHMRVYLLLLMLASYHSMYYFHLFQDLPKGKQLSLWLWLTLTEYTPPTLNSSLNNHPQVIQLLISPVLPLSLIAGGHGLDEEWAGLASAVAAPITDWWIDCSIAASESVPWARAPRLREGIPAMAPAMVPLLWAACRGPLGLATQGAALTHILLSRPWRHTLWGQAGRCVGFATE